MMMSELTAMSETVRRIEVFTGAGRRRAWSAADKARIVAESYAPGASVCAVARRHGLSPQQLFTWRRNARRDGVPEEPPAFAPVVLDTTAAPAVPGAPMIEIVVGDTVVR